MNYGGLQSVGCLCSVVDRMLLHIVAWIFLKLSWPKSIHNLGTSHALLSPMIH